MNLHVRIVDDADNVSFSIASTITTINIFSNCIDYRKGFYEENIDDCF